jgi:hypothetical protein
MRPFFSRAPYSGLAGLFSYREALEMDCPHTILCNGDCNCRQQIRGAAKLLPTDDDRQTAAKAADDRDQPGVAAAILEANNEK